MSIGVAVLRIRTDRAQRLKLVTPTVYRVLANTLGQSRQRLDSDNVPLDEAPSDITASALARWRGRIDALAMRARFCDMRIYQEFVPKPQGAAALFSSLEQNRVELLGACRWIGVRDNLCAHAEQEWARARSKCTASLHTVALLARVPLGAPLPAAVLAELRSNWSSSLTAEQAKEIEALVLLTNDQSAYARQSLRVVEALQEAVAVVEAQSSVSVDATIRQDDDVSSPPSGQASRVASSSSLEAAQCVVASDEGEREAQTKALPAATDVTYRAYTQAFDRVVRADQLCDSERLELLRRKLDDQVAEQVGGVSRWAHRLQRRLLARQALGWQFDREEGLLDSSRLTRLLTRPFEPLLYKQEDEAVFPATAVTLLVDCSGSMRGSAIATAALCAELLGRALERCGVMSEVLGFTTSSWRGGRPRKQWLDAGRPPQPGRLNELCHIIFKDANEPWRRARARLGMMLDADLLKENIDGEALLWARARLQRMPTRRRILIVISDGAPLDDATIQVNDAQYLDRHLSAVVRQLQEQSRVELVAVGIEHDVSRYYRRAVNLAGPSALGEAVATQLLSLFDESSSRHRQQLQAERRKR